MKVNLLFNSNELESGYLNLDPFAGPTDKYKRQANPMQLNHLVDLCSCEHLLVRDVVNYLQEGDIGQALTHWASFLAHNGKLTLTGIDFVAVCRDYGLGRIDRNTLTQNILGVQSKRIQSLPEYYTLLESLKQLGLNPVEKRLVDYKFVISVVRQ